MNNRYHCPKHSERTPSAQVYGENWFCFGCGAKGHISELGLEVAHQEIVPKYVEDLKRSIPDILRLPRRLVRGFELPYSQYGYYLVWPDHSYYKFRLLGVESGSKYRGPSGHVKVPFPARIGVTKKSIALVEGEFNALSYALLNPECDVISPGGAGDFYGKCANTLLSQCLSYETIYLVVDCDAAGAKAAIEAKARLGALSHTDVRVKLVSQDFNDLLCQEGKEALEEYIKTLGMPTRLPKHTPGVSSPRKASPSDAAREGEHRPRGSGCPRNL